MINEILLEGAEHAQTGRYLCSRLGISLRELTTAIEQERREGHPICAASGKNPGYFLAANQDEMQRYCKRLLHRAGELHKTRKACIKTIKELPVMEAQ